MATEKSRRPPALAEQVEEPDPKDHNPRAVNPRYRGLRMSDIARAILRPKDRKVRERLEQAEELAK